MKKTHGIAHGLEAQAAADGGAILEVVAAARGDSYHFFQCFPPAES
jgi:hypothetical protein